MKKYHITYHTYDHTVQGHGRASSRLDRWYVNDVARMWAASTEIDRYGHAGDHKDVLLHIRNPTDTTRVKREDRVFPVQPYAQGRVDQFVQQQLQIFGDTITNNNLSAQETARQWDKLIDIIVTGILCRKRGGKEPQKHVSEKVKEAVQKV